MTMLEMKRKEGIQKCKIQVKHIYTFEECHQLFLFSSEKSFAVKEFMWGIFAGVGIGVLLTLAASKYFTKQSNKGRNITCLEHLA